MPKAPPFGGAFLSLKDFEARQSAWEDAPVNGMPPRPPKKQGGHNDQRKGSVPLLEKPDGMRQLTEMNEQKQACENNQKMKATTLKNQDQG
jgi:hypothetical protein